eukprot:357308-Chlamydomonas_euryale.AAC.13
MTHCWLASSPILGGLHVRSYSILGVSRPGRHPSWPCAMHPRHAPCTCICCCRRQRAISFPCAPLIVLPSARPWSTSGLDQGRKSLIYKELCESLPASHAYALNRATRTAGRESVGAAGSMGGGASAADVSKADPEVARMMAQADASTSEAARDLEATKQVTEKVKAKVGALERRGKRTTTGGTDFIIGRGGSLGLRHFAMKGA